MNRVQTDLQQVQKKISKEKQRYSTLLEKYEQLQNSNSTAQLVVVDTSQQEDHNKSEELQTSMPLDEDTMTELTKLQLKMEDVSVSLEKVNTVKKYWEQVCVTNVYANTLRIHMLILLILLKAGRKELAGQASSKMCIN